MVARLTISALAAFAALGLTAAQAADYPQPLPPPVIIQQPPEEFAAGWYLRGDIGFSNQQVGSLWNENYNGYASVENADKGFDAAPFFGLGIGYYVNDWLRLDVTGEYRARANFHGLDIATTSGGERYPDRYTGSKYEWTFLFNGYVDLGTWSGFTPFVGAGVGFSRNTITNFSDTGERTSAEWRGDDGTKWSFAWALYAGVGYKITKNFTIELAYRYIDLGDATTGTMHTTYGSLPDETPFEFKNLTSHDLKLGIRYNFDAYEAAPPVQYYAPPPVYTAPPVYAPPPGYAPLHSRG
jgi:opacity protein-like surface antigen